MYTEEINSTNTYLKELMQTGALPEPLSSEALPCVWVGYQTAGRGQQGNGWESERGKNLTYSILIRNTGLKADEQWRMSMFVPVVLCEVLEQYVSGIRIKWPNDLYVGDRKLAGILIEHSLQGSEIAYSVVGVGLNVNQEVFHAAPNPVSLKQLTGKDTNLAGLMDQIVDATQAKMVLISNEKLLREKYMKRLYRSEGFYPYVEREVSTAPTMNETKRTIECFEAEIKTITPQGQLVLRLRSGEERTYHFKQIRYVVE